jgi:hypothetical protein
MLAMADHAGRIWASIPGLANRARVSIERCEEALGTLMSPDKYSRTKDHDGRRISEIDGGWRLLNHAKYKAIRDEESIKESKRRYINERRAREREAQASPTDVYTNSTSSTVDRSRANAEADTESESELIHVPTVLVGSETPDAPKRVDCPYQKLLELYHKRCPTMTQVRVLTNMRMKHARARWVETLADHNGNEAETLDFFGWYFDMANASPFLSGRKGNDRRPWKADFEWLMKAENFAKVIEGKYGEQK